MTNVIVKDGNAAFKELKARGVGSNADPFVPEHDVNVLGTVTTTTPAGFPATENTVNQIAGRLPQDSGKLATRDARSEDIFTKLNSLEAKAPLLVGGALPVTGPLTDVQLRATPILTKASVANLAFFQFTANGQTQSIAIDGTLTAVINLNSNGSMQFAIEVSFDGGGVWESAFARLRQNSTTTFNTLSVIAGDRFTMYVPCAGATNLRLRCASFTSGTCDSRMTGSLLHTNFELLAFQPVVGTTAQGGAVGNGAPSQVALESRTTNRTATGDGQVSRPIVDTRGRQIFAEGQIRELTDTNVLTLTATTETTLIAAVASVFHDVRALVITNTSATDVRVDFRDSTAGTVRLSVLVKAASSLPVIIPNRMKQAAVNTSWTAQLSVAVTDVRITAISERM